MQSMYLVLVTNKSSNILEDLETLRLCGKVVPEYVDALEEEEVRGLGGQPPEGALLLSQLQPMPGRCLHRWWPGSLRASRPHA